MFWGGQIIVGTIASAIAFCILSPLKAFGNWLSSEQKGSVGILAPVGTAIPQIEQSLPDDVEACFIAIRNLDADNQEFVFELRWTTAAGKTSATDILGTLRTNHRVTSFEHRTTVT